MRIIKHGHACVTLVTDTATIVIDPGMPDKTLVASWRLQKFWSP